MKVTVNDKDIYELSDSHKYVLSMHPTVDDLNHFVKERIKYILTHKHERCLDRLEREWMPKLRDAGVASVPSNKAQLCEMIFARPEYKCRKEKEEAEGNKDLFDQIHKTPAYKPIREDMVASSSKLNEIQPLVVKVDGEIVVELTPMQQKVIMNDIHADIFLQDCCRRIHYVIYHPIMQMVDAHRSSWSSSLSSMGVESVPLDDMALIELVYVNTDNGRTLLPA